MSESSSLPDSILRAPPYEQFNRQLIFELPRNGVLQPDDMSKLSRQGEAAGYFLLIKIWKMYQATPVYRPFDYIRRPNYWNMLLGPAGGMWMTSDEVEEKFSGLLGTAEDPAGSDRWQEIFSPGDTRRNLKVGFYLLTNKLPVRGKNSSVQAFNFTSSSSFDLKFAQIYQKHELAIFREDRVRHCLLHTLKQAGVDDTSIQSIAYNCIGDGTRHVSTIDLKKVANYLKRKICLSRVNKNGDAKSDFRIRKVMIGKETQNGPALEMAIYENHIFHNIDLSVNIDLLRQSIDQYAIPLMPFSKLLVKPALWVVKHLHTLGAFSIMTTEEHNAGRDEKLDDFVKTPSEEKVTLSSASLTEQNQRIFQKQDRKERNEMYFAADCESFTMNGQTQHQLALLGICKVVSPDLWHSVNVQIYSFLQNPVDKMLRYVYRQVTGSDAGDYNSDTEDGAEILQFQDHESAIEHKAIPVRNKKKRKRQDTTAVIFFHNLRYDRAVLQEHLYIHDILEKNNSLYSMKVSFCGLIVEFRDSLKHVEMSLATMCSAFDLPPELRKKECGINYDYFSKENLDQRITVQQYVDSSGGRFSVEEILPVLTDAISGYCEETQTINPWKLYKYYLKYDVLCLATSLFKYQECGTELSLSYLRENSIDPLSFTTKSSYSKCLARQGGVFDDSAEYSGSLRKYIMQSIRGGRVTCHPEFEGKQTIASSSGIMYMDAVSEYPSAIVEMCESHGGFPTGLAMLMTSKSCITDPATFYFICDIKITNIKKKLLFSYPIIAYKEPGSSSVAYIQDLPNGQPFIVTIGKIDLEEYIRFHDIEFEFIQGIKWPSTSKPNPEWGAMINHLFEQRKVYKAAKNTPMSNALKNSMNSQYGSCITQIADAKTTMLSKRRPDIEQALCNIFHSIIEFYDLGKVLQLKRTCVDISYVSCLFGSIVLCMSRRISNRLLLALEQTGVYALYGDTDSCMFDSKHLDLIQYNYEQLWNRRLEGTELGQFHSDFENIPGCINQEAIRSSKLFLIGKKIYCHEVYGPGANGSIVHGRQYKCKGIPKKSIEYAALCLDQCINTGISSIYDSLSPMDSDYDQENNLIDRSVNFAINPNGSVRFVYAKNRTVSTPSELFFRKVSRKPLRNSEVMIL